MCGGSIMRGKSYSEILREASQPIWEKIAAHPFIAEMRDGTLPREKFRYYVVQDYAYLMVFANCLGIAAAKATDVETKRALASFKHGCLTSEVKMLEDLCSRLGIDWSRIGKHEPAPTNMAYTRHLLSVAYSGTVGETITAMLPCIWTYQLIGESMVDTDRLKTHTIYDDWAAAYRSQSYIELVNRYTEIVNRCADDAGTQERDRMRRHFNLSSRYEYMFWEMAYRLETWPVR
jgi:thiaminase/transcriptional activator TenA